MQLKINADTATEAANTAAGNANGKATLANEKAAYAQTQGDYAKAQGEAAHEAASGDASDRTVNTFDAVTDEFPVIGNGKKLRNLFGTLKKFCEDFNNIRNGLITVGKLINDGLCTEEGYALDARFGKILKDQLDKQNSDLASITGLIVKDITLNPGYAIYGTWATRIIKDKSSGICVINLAIRKADNSVINTNTYVDIGILPDGFLPIYPTGASGIGEEPGAINHPVGIILFEGKIKATTYGENTRNIIASFSYSTN